MNPGLASCVTTALTCLVSFSALAETVDLTPLGPAGSLALPTEMAHQPVFQPPPQRGEGLVLIDGTNELTIVTVNKKVRAGLWTLGEELKYHLETMSGQTVRLVEPADRPASGPVIVIGADDGQVPEGTSLVRRNGDELYIGGEGAGISHAVTYVLEALGCRYLFPGKAGKIIPRKNRVVLPDFELNYTPSLKVRIVRTPTVGNSSVNESLEELGISPAEFAAAQKLACYDRNGNRGFWQWHGLGDAKIVATDQPAYQSIVLAGHHFNNYWDLYQDTHPEWFALQPDGTREQTSRHPRLCTSNRALRDNIVQECLGRIDAKPEQLGHSICMPDGSYDSFCFCEECRKLDPTNAPKRSGYLYKPSKHPYEYVSLTDRMIDFSNYVQAEVRTLRPGKRLVQFAYSGYSAPPVLLRPDPDLVFFNVAGSYIDAANYSGARRNLAGWLSLGNEVVWRPNCLQAFECPYPMNFARLVFDDIEAVKANGAVGVSFDCCTAGYATRGFMYYMLAKAVLNPDRLSFDDIAADWYRAGFGSAAKAVAAYQAELERVFHAAARRAIGTRGYQEAFDEEKASSLLDAAAAAAGGDAEVLERIDYLRVGVGYARESKRVYDGWATGRAEPMNAARTNYLEWVRQEALLHPFQFPRSCPYMAGDSYSPSDGELYNSRRTDALVLTDDRTVYVPAGVTNFYQSLDGAAFQLTKTGGGVLQIGRVANTNVSIVVCEGDVVICNPRPARLDDAFFHVDASAAETLETEVRGGTNVVVRWNDADGRPGRYAVPSGLTDFGRTDPANRLPFVGAERQNGLPYVDFGTLAVPGYTNAAGVAIGHGAALQWAEDCADMREGFTVASDTPDIDDFTNRYASATSYYPMSLFACSSSSCGYRGEFSASHRPPLYNDTAYNYGYTCGTNYLNGAQRSWRIAFPAGFQLLNVVTDRPVKVNAFGCAYKTAVGSAIVKQRVFGGTRIAEQCVFTNVLSEADRADVTRYLQAKWFPQTLKSVTVKGDARFLVDSSSSLTVLRYVDYSLHAGDLVLTEDTTIDVPAGEMVGYQRLSGAFTLTKTGGGTLLVDRVTDAATAVVVKDGEFRVAAVKRPSVLANALIHLDAAADSTLTTETVGGTNFVTRWADANGGVYEATNTAEARTWRTNPENRRAYLSYDQTEVGLPMVDMGTPMVNGVTNELGETIGYGAAMVLNVTKARSCREFFTVTSDNEAWKQASLNDQAGPNFLGNTYGEMDGRRGASATGYYPLMFTAWSSNAGSKLCYYGTNTLDGAKISSSSRFPEGVHVLNCLPTGSMYANALGRNYRDSGAKCDVFGGIRYGEVLIFTNMLSGADRTNVTDYLITKWRKQTLASVTVDGGRFAVAEGVALAVGRYVVCDGPDVYVPAGVQTNFDTFASLDVYAHFDASDPDSLVMNAVNGTNFVTRWKSLNDPEGLYATNYPGNPKWTSGRPAFRPDPENRFAYLTSNASETGLSAVDFGSFLWKDDSDGSEGYGAAMQWNKNGGAVVAEFFTVAADDTSRTWPTHSSSRGIGSYLGNVQNDSHGIRGSAGGLFSYWDAQAGTKRTSIEAKAVLLDGAVTNYNAAKPPAGFHVVNNVPGSPCLSDAFAHQHRNTTIDTYGGIKIGEFLALKTAIADETVRTNVNAYLMNKWLGTPRGIRVYQTIDVSMGASFGIVREDVSVANLSVGGMVTASAFTNVTALAATGAAGEIVGSLALADGATLDFAQQADGAWTTLKTGTVVVEGAVTIRLDLLDPQAMRGQEVRLLAATDLPAELGAATVVCPKARGRVALEVRADGLYARFGNPGLLLLVK